MLADSFALAEREIRLLRQAEHPNLLRYYCSEKDKERFFKHRFYMQMKYYISNI